MTTTLSTAPGQDLETKPPKGGWSLPSADHVKQKLTEAKATPDQISTILWLLDFGRTRKQSLTALAKEVSRDGSSISRIFNGKYGAGLDEFVSHIKHFRRVIIERLDLGERVIIETKVLKEIADFCDLTRVTATMALIFGSNQTGKSVALERYKDLNNHGRTIYVRMPVGGSAKMFMTRLMRACGISERNSYDQMIDRAHRFFDPQTLLIVDEVHQAMIGRTLKTVTIELIREIRDLCHCGVVLCGTDVLTEMFSDPRFKKFLGQINNRGVLRLNIPTKPCQQDIDAICNTYGFDPATGEAKVIVKQIAANDGIGRLTEYLLMARRMASKRGVPVAWEHFLITHANLIKWAKGEE